MEMAYRERWEAEIAAMRRVLAGFAMKEERKWGKPTYTVDGKNVVILRGQKVILDRDLASLYRVTTSNLNKAVSRNLQRFPADFMFQLSASERSNLIFQSGTSSWGGTRKPPRAFTEQGVAMTPGPSH